MINRADKPSVAATKCILNDGSPMRCNKMLHLNLKLNLSAGIGREPTSDMRDLLDNSRVRSHRRWRHVLCREGRTALLTAAINFDAKVKSGLRSSPKIANFLPSESGIAFNDESNFSSVKSYENIFKFEPFLSVRANANFLYRFFSTTFS